VLERGASSVAHELRSRRGDNIGLASRLGANLGVDAVAQAQRQRDAESDDGQQQQVGRGQQKAGSQAYGAGTSGVMKRNPTPRTVSM
jgi:hypothetical protein